MNKKQKKILYRIIISALVFLISLICRGYIGIILLLSAYIIAGYDVLWKAIRNTVRGKAFDENFLMALATISAVVTGEYHEAVFVMIFYQTGELFQSIAVGKSRKSIAKLMEICPDYANIEKNGELEAVDPYEIKAGDIIVAKAGEKIPLDGIITEGATSVNTAAITGESLPRDLNEGDTVISGCVNLSGTIKIKVTKEYSESTVSKILELTENATINKAKSEKFITRFASVYTPAVVILAFLLAVLPPVFISVSDFEIWKIWLYRAMTLLVISCPCALVISVPLSFFAGIGAMSRKGILVKGGSFIESLARCKTVIFDKTGTLTEGKNKVSSASAVNVTENELIKYAASAEYYSDHPLSKAVKEICKEKDIPTQTKELAGMGVIAKFGNDTVAVGNVKLMEYVGAMYQLCDKTCMHVSKNGEYLGYIEFTDTVKQSAKKAVNKLYSMGITEAVMLSGDSEKTAREVAKKTDIKTVYAELLPKDKLDITESIIENAKGKVAFVGDGINDAPALARADVGIAMGAMGSDAAVEAADIVLMDDDPEKIAVAIEKCKKTVGIVYQNIYFVLAVKFAAIVLGTFGVLGMWAAVFADVGVAVIAILNSMRNK